MIIVRSNSPLLDAFKAMLHGNMKEGYAKVIRLPNLSPVLYLHNI